MEDMDELEQICFEIISYVGTAKSCYVNSIAKAKEGDFATAAELVKQGDEAYNGGHEVHMRLASGRGVRRGHEDAAAAPPPRRGSDGECRDLQAHGAELRRHLS